MSIERWQYFSEVTLVNCCIDDKVANVLANNLNWSVMKTLVLDFNRISDSGVVL